MMKAEVQIEIRRENIHDHSVYYRRCGSGQPLLLVHGWPFHGGSFEKLMRFLGNSFSCFAPDLPGMGETSFNDKTDFSFAGQAQFLAAFAKAAIKEPYICIAHNTGATMARLMALSSDSHMGALVLLNTEIPGHRPPCIGFYQTFLLWPGARSILRFLISLDLFRTSPMGYGGCFSDSRMLNQDFVGSFVAPLIERPDRLEGVVRYLCGLDFSVVDSLADLHKDIKIPVHMIWGEDDPTFPLKFAREMVRQFNAPPDLCTIPGTKFLAYMEQPDRVAALVHEFCVGLALR
ncbi:MAG: alpha/beta hydrolase [Leptospirales bacterium]|nr:alpha/beta hydrolase [Leptospirales bacterium]